MLAEAVTSHLVVALSKVRHVVPLLGWCFCGTARHAGTRLLAPLRPSWLTPSTTARDGSMLAQGYAPYFFDLD